MLTLGFDRVQSITMSELVTNPEAMFRISSDEHDFKTGLTAVGNQVLMGILYPSLVAIMFDVEGKLDHVERRPAPTPRIVSGHPQLFDAEYEAKYLGLLRDWQRVIGFTEKPITVRKFSIDGVAVFERPSHFNDFIRDPIGEEPNELERRRIQEMIARWEREGRFVLRWGKDFWMNADGTIHST